MFRREKMHGREKRRISLEMRRENDMKKSCLGLMNNLNRESLIQ